MFAVIFVEEYLKTHHFKGSQKHRLEKTAQYAHFSYLWHIIN